MAIFPLTIVTIELGPAAMVESAGIHPEYIPSKPSIRLRDAARTGAIEKLKSAAAHPARTIRRVVLMTPKEHVVCFISVFFECLVLSPLLTFFEWETRQGILRLEGPQTSTGGSREN
jgi:hypothetical protein